MPSPELWEELIRGAVQFAVGALGGLAGYFERNRHSVRRAFGMSIGGGIAGLTAGAILNLAFPDSSGDLVLLVGIAGALGFIGLPWLTDYIKQRADVAEAEKESYASSESHDHKTDSATLRQLFENSGEFNRHELEEMVSQYRHQRDEKRAWRAKRAAELEHAALSEQAPKRPE